MGLDMWVSANNDGNFEDCVHHYWRKAYIIQDWFEEYAASQGMTKKRGWHSDINCKFIQIPQTVLVDLINRCKKTSACGTNVLNELFPVRNWSSKVEVRECFNAVIDSIKPLEEVLRDHDWKKPLYFYSWW